MPVYTKSALDARSIYDVYLSQTSAHDYHYTEPRLGLFPPSPHLAPPPLTPAPPNGLSTSALFVSPVKAISRPGGMRISALLNDDGNDGLRSGSRGPDVDAASDGTVSERDAEGGVSRASPRSAATLPVSSWQTERYGRRLSGGSSDRPDLDRFRSNSDQSQYDTRPPEWPRRQMEPGYYPPRAAAVVPSFTHHTTPPSWDPPRNPSLHHPSFGVFPSRSNGMTSDRDHHPVPPRDGHRSHVDPGYVPLSDWRGYPPPNGGFGNLPPLKGTLTPPRQSRTYEESSVRPTDPVHRTSF